MKSGVYGGTFNPIHLGHLTAARAAMEQLGLDRLFFIPAGMPPHKPLAPGTPPAEDRLALTRLGAEYLEGAEVLDAELRRKGRSYTLDTVRALRRRFPKDRLYLLVGSDMFLSFQNWRRPGDILRCCVLAGFRRTAGEDGARLSAQRDYLKKTYRAQVVLVDLPGVVDVSSTELREALPRGGGREALPEAVYGYILRRRLYGVDRDLRALDMDDLRCAAVSMLKHRRIPHVLGTAETARALAARYGEDESAAERAALLHDCTKKCTREQHLALCRQYHIELSGAERMDDHLLHAVTGAAVAKHVYGLSDASCSAIRWHTTGRPGMTALEKILYLADYIEPTRDFCDLTALRALAFEDLDRAMLLGLEMAVGDLAARGVRVDEQSLRARDYLKGTLL